MSGHTTYNCELDRKPHIRGICINSMSDRAFNVYTEFYTHTQNMCWFLRGQIWQETMSENTWKVTKQLEESAQNQEKLLVQQKESLGVSESILKHGKIVESVLSDLSISTLAHQEIIRVLADTVSNLQYWVIGEISWLNTVVFYCSFSALMFFITSTNRTVVSRFHVLVLALFFAVLERLLYFFILKLGPTNPDSGFLYQNIQSYVWFLRYSLIFTSLFMIFYRALYYKDLHLLNSELLVNIQRQNCEILGLLHKLLGPKTLSDRINVVTETKLRESLENALKNNNKTPEQTVLFNRNISFEVVEREKSKTPKLLHSYSDYSTNLDNVSNSSKENISLNSSLSGSISKKPLSEIQNRRYNLRSRQATPEVF